MSRCQHCNKLTHSEDLYVTYKIEDYEKMHEIRALTNWTPVYMYNNSELEKSYPREYGKLKCGDIYVHFVALDNPEDK